MSTKERLTTDHPRTNVETALNLFYENGNQTWVRSGGAAPEFPDISLNDYIRQIIHDHDAQEWIDPRVDDLELSEALSEALFDGPDTIEGLIATLYTVAWAYSMLREKLMQYEDDDGNDLLIHLPVKIGSKVYRLQKINGEDQVCVGLFSLADVQRYGKTVFGSARDAALALSKQGGGHEQAD